MAIAELHKEIDKRWSKHLAETRKGLRIPSVSMTGEGIKESANYFEGLLKKLGAKTSQFKGTTKSHPLVYGHLDVGAKKTVLLYGMYDVQPVGDLKEWEHPPFGATIVKKKPYGEVLVNRGVYNSKGSLLGSLLAIDTMLDKEMMPLNIHFLLEGEEECGGFSLPYFIKKNKGKLSKADAALWFDYSEDSTGKPQISLGMKGVTYFDLIAEGKDRGGPKDELHSSGAVLVESPVWRLVHAISTMVDENQHPTIDGLWDDVAKPDRDDLELTKKLTKRLTLKMWQKEWEVERFKVEGPIEDILLKYMFEPSINIDGLSAGFEEDGTKTVLPPKAMAKLDIRLVPNMTIEGTRKKVMEHLRRRGFTDIKMRNYEDYPVSKVPLKEDICQACIEGMKFDGREPEVWPMMAGSAPMYLFDQVLGVPHCGAGLGYGGKAHSPNEFAVVSKMKDFEKSAISVMWKFAEISSRNKAR
ncbi:MAG TPA: M20/M25/M40 family metallo-hydrolase [Thermoplasmata archaeon]|nr:M20/M25/M40 family metallo-hydrolase [Thermoplasmata archaeon]